MLSELVFLGTALFFAADAPPSSPALPFQIIVNRESPVSSLSRAQLSAIFMKRARSWPDGSEIVPIDLPVTSPEREQFSRAIHGKRVAYVTRYWQRLTFAGRGVPPLELKSSAHAIAFVKRTRGAIAYIDGQTPPGEEVKVIEVTR